MLCIFLACLHSVGQQSVFPNPIKVEPLPSVQGTTLEFRLYEQPRPLKVWCLRVDLNDPDLAHTVSKPAPKGAMVKVAGNPPKEIPAETLSQTTLDFARTEKLDIAINASPFYPVVKFPGQPLDINGLHLRDHQQVSPPLNGYACWTLSPDHRLRFFQGRPPYVALNRALIGTGGFGMVIVDGRVVDRQGKEDPLHPRTALGLEQNAAGEDKAMVWLVIDGRQPKVSEGVGLVELGNLGQQLGLKQLLNLDGGGSSTLVVVDPSSKEESKEPAKTGPHVKNTPVGLGNIPGTLRPNGNNWGLWRVTTQSGITSQQLKQFSQSLTVGQLLRLTGPLNNALRHLQLQDPESRSAFLALLALPGGPLGEKNSQDKSESPGGISSWPPIATTQPALAAELGYSPQEMTALLAEPDGKILLARWWWQSSSATQSLQQNKLPALLNLSTELADQFRLNQKKAREILSQKPASGG